MRAQRIEMRARFRIEVIGDQRCGRRSPGASRILAVEDPQRVAFKPSAAVLVERVLVLAKVSCSSARYALRDSGVPSEFISSAQNRFQSLPQACPSQNQLRIDVRAGEAEGFDVDLVKLAIPAFLRFFVAEHRSLDQTLQALIVREAVGDRRAHHARGRFGPQRQALPTLVDERVHLLFDDVGEFADGTLEESVCSTTGTRISS